MIVFTKSLLSEDSSSNFSFSSGSPTGLAGNKNQNIKQWSTRTLVIIACGSFIAGQVIGHMLGSASNGSLFSRAIGSYVVQEEKRPKAKIGITLNDDDATTDERSADGDDEKGHEDDYSAYRFDVSDILPTSLQSNYTNLQFRVTPSLLRRSRPVVGNVERLHTFLQKLRNGRCTNTLMLGGSVTAGHNGGGPGNAYPNHLMDIFDAKYPCVDSKTGQSGRHTYFKTPATNAQQQLTFYNQVLEYDGAIDLVVVEYNINDTFLNGIPHAFEDKGPYSKVSVRGSRTSPAYNTGFYFEILIRRLLILRKPDPVAIVTFSADYVGATWTGNQHNSREMLFKRNNEPMKLWVSSMYDIPVFSVVQWLLPMSNKLGLEASMFSNKWPYSTANWHADKCCHPKKAGHKVLALTLAHCFAEEEKMMLSGLHDSAVPEEQDYTLDQTNPILRTPLYLSPEEDKAYVWNDKANQTELDFSDPESKSTWESQLVMNDGWTWYADNKEQDKFGIIANNNGTDGGQHIAFRVVGGDVGRVEISFLVSYENFGIGLAWLDKKTNMTELGEEMKRCQTPIPNMNKQYPNTKFLSGVWGQEASVPISDFLENSMNHGEEMILHICLTPRNEKVRGDLNKFKLIGVAVY